MLALPRTLFAVLLTALIGIFFFFQFRGILFSLAEAVTQQAKAADEQISMNALNNQYSLVVRSKSKPDAAPILPDISRYTVDNIAAQAPAFAPGKVEIAGMAGFPGLREFVSKDGRLQRLRLSQVSVSPKAIVIRQGHYDFTRLYDEVKARTSDDVIRKSGRKYLLRMPILVGENASLTISDKDTEELRLSQEQTVFIANAGNLFIIRTKVVGWSETRNGAALFRDKRIYRPFLVSWSGARMNIAGSSIASLGYQKGKSYGLTYSTCEPCLEKRPGLPWPTGAIVANAFSDMYFGFYSYEAEDIAIVGNTFLNNAVYAIDPHDRSRRLIIAGNETYGSQQKHGIILSRNVNNSWIFNNSCHHNRGSGIMIDRASENNVLANNVSAHNGGDGITFFESPNNVLYGNHVYKNALSGVRIRNSWNIRMLKDQILDNGRVPVVVYTSRLEDSQPLRNFGEDPYTRRADAEIAGIIMKLPDNKPAFKIDGVGHLSLSNIHLLSGGTVLDGRMFPDEKNLSENMSTPHRTAIVTNRKTPLQLSGK